MPLMVAVLAVVMLEEGFTGQKKAGFVLLATGVVGIVWGSGGTIGTTQNIGHLFFLGAALAFACYTVAMRRARLDGLHAAAISAVGSMLIYMPPYSILAGSGIFDASSGAIALQALVQGLLTAAFSYVAYRLAGRIPLPVNGPTFT